MNKQDRFTGCLLGLACGDAVGTTVEFKPRGSFEPVTDMIGGGYFDLKAGQWTDDTSMALCIADSLVKMGCFDARDIMDRFCLWRSTGYRSSTGKCFDIGGVTAQALAKYYKDGNPYAGSSKPNTAGNGCLMRLAPVPMFHCYDGAGQIMKYSILSSKLTHNAKECLEAISFFSEMLWMALGGCPKQMMLNTMKSMDYGSKGITSIAAQEYRDKSRDEIKGSGHVVESLEAALWCFDKTDSFKDAVLMAVNLGDDADTTGAIVGQLAGAFYGVGAIPKGWLKKLHLRKEIEALAIKLMR